MKQTIENALADFIDGFKTHFVGVVICAIITLAAALFATHFQIPAMLSALLIGMLLSGMATRISTAKCGIDFSAKKILQFGIILLGARVSLPMIFALGWQTLALVVLAIAATLAFGWLVGRRLGLSTPLSLLTAGSVAICGTSAAMAIAAILPQSKAFKKDLTLTIVFVTALSTIGMITYPFIFMVLFDDAVLVGKILGISLHNVPQAIGAGFTLSEAAGEVATIVKLMRVSLLAPVIVILAWGFNRQSGSDANAAEKPKILPLFILGFIILTSLNSLGAIPAHLQTFMVFWSKQFLVMSIAAIGLKTKFTEFMTLSPRLASLLILETAFIALFGSVGFWLLL